MADVGAAVTAQTFTLDMLPLFPVEWLLEKVFKSNYILECTAVLVVR